MKHTGLLLLTCALLSACATGPQIDTSLDGHLPAAYGWNIGAADLLDPATGPCRLGTYLDELTAQGYARQIRLIYTSEWGPQIRDTWLPVIRAKGYRVLAILSQHPGDKDLARLDPWIRSGLPAIVDVLDGVQLANEPDGYSGMTPTQYTDWHRQVASIVRQVAPGVPILSPDFRGVGAWNDWVMRTQLDYGRDYDVVSLHVTHVTGVNDLQTYVNDVKRWTQQTTPRVWITEGDWGQRVWFDGHGLPVERSYVYVYNGHEPESRRTGGDPICHVE